MSPSKDHSRNARFTQRRQLVKLAGAGVSVVPYLSLYSCATDCLKRNTANLDSRDGTRLSLAHGLKYTELDRNGNILMDGSVSPGRPDGMGCFLADDNSWILMRNHEIDLDDIGTSDGRGAYPLDNVPKQAYSRTDFGGVSRIVIDPNELKVIESNMVLSGTRRNCAGGVTPYGWLSCEETLERDGGENHGFVFLCDINAKKLQEPKRIDAYGRFVHEAAGFDPRTGRCYLTEDISTASLYRFLPDDVNTPFKGKLQALRVLDEHAFNASQMSIGESRLIDWIDVPDPMAGIAIHRDAQSLGAAVFAYCEGCWFHNDLFYFAASKGGPNGKGQVFQLNDNSDKATLTLLAQSDSETDLCHPDNLTLSPSGEIYIAEDNDGGCLIQHLAQDGTLTALARNRERGEEIAGLCFSPDGKVLFGNIQEPGITFAISGF